jgi:calcium-dependent protein kinase
MGGCFRRQQTVNSIGKTIPDAKRLKGSGIRDKYKFEDIIGNGNFGKVIRARNRTDSSNVVAIKAIKTSKIENANFIIEEIRILRTLDHPNIVKYYETFEGDQYIYIVMEYCSGGELFDKILEREIFGEKEAARILEKLLKAINHCHTNNVAHRDIKPENILYANRESVAEIKLIDFGLSKLNPAGGGKLKKLDTVVGTPYYVAPEVLEGKYNYECDLWSLGVIMYVLLSGYLPFGGKSTTDVFNRIRKARVSFEKKEWDKVSDVAKDLVKKLLEPDRKLRLTAGKALQHEWFAQMSQIKVGSKEDRLDPTIIESLKQYKGTSTFQKEAMNVLVRTLQEKEIDNLREAFKKIDTDNTGYINCEELSVAFEGSGMTITHDEINKIIKNVDYFGNGKINYSEFLAATVSTKKFLTQEKLWTLFKHFDIDNTGYITAENLKQVMRKRKTGKMLDDSEIEAMIKAHDIEENGKISFDEFKIMMNKISFEPKEDFFTSSNSLLNLREKTNFQQSTTTK